MNFEQEYQITPKEREAIIQLIADRYRNFVYVEAENTVRKAFNIIGARTDVTNRDTLRLTFIVDQVVADLLVELGACRRQSWLRRIIGWVK
jgi:hypothetical protein